MDADKKQTQRRIRTETRTWIHRKPWTCPRIRNLAFDVIFCRVFRVIVLGHAEGYSSPHPGAMVSDGLSA